VGSLCIAPEVRSTALGGADHENSDVSLGRLFTELRKMFKIIELLWVAVVVRPIVLMLCIAEQPERFLYLKSAFCQGRDCVRGKECDRNCPQC
jgi:hypothetical protein